MKKRTREALNMFFSAFLIIAYLVCSYYITKFAESVNSENAYSAIILVVVALFGTMLFYATRVGDGKQIIRFSPSVLIMVVLPSLYIVSAYFAVGLPLHEQVQNSSVLMYLSCVTLGYGIPYTFTSGFEMVAAEDVYYPEHFENGENKAENEKTADKKSGKNKKK